MTSRPPLLRRHNGGQLPPNSVAHSELVRRRGGLISVPGGKLTLPPEITRRFTKLLLNVNIQGSLGPVQVVMSPENAVGDLIKAAIEIYVKEMRRPLLNESDPRHLELHYSQFSLESLKAEDKLINLGSRNFYLCRKPTSVSNSTCSDEAKKVAKSAFPFTKFMDFLL
ncbi:hypothetical protein CsSME_00050268 [Camellia sinensis var. sinensis]